MAVLLAILVMLNTCRIRSLGKPMNNERSLLPILRSISIQLILSFGTSVGEEQIDTGLRSTAFRVEIPNQPALILQPRSSLTTVQFNPKDSQQILAGCVNGQLCQ